VSSSFKQHILLSVSHTALATTNLLVLLLLSCKQMPTCCPSCSLCPAPMTTAFHAPHLQLLLLLSCKPNNSISSIYSYWLQSQCMLAPAQTQQCLFYTSPTTRCTAAAAVLQADADLLPKLQPVPSTHDNGDHFEAALYLADPSLFNAAPHQQQQQQQQQQQAVNRRKCRSAALRALLVDSCKQPGFAQLPQHTVPATEQQQLKQQAKDKEAKAPAGLAGIDSPLVLLLRKVANWWLYHVAYGAPAHVAWLARDCELLFRLMAPQQQLACMADILLVLACPVFYTDK
jgi:hypothetical protein